MFSSKLWHKLDPLTQVLMINCIQIRQQNIDLHLGYASKASKVEATGFEETESGIY